ncbi:hypothetical protein LZ30DRAFT_808980 [Colletotrichum cereale]|nr:hypothetical protein LZ30DRAFT_808980 [Colletotrichum cereale]
MASILSIFIVCLCDVSRSFAELNSLSQSAAIAGIARISKASWLTRGYCSRWSIHHCSGVSVSAIGASNHFFSSSSTRFERWACCCFCLTVFRNCWYLDSSANIVADGMMLGVEAGDGDAEDEDIELPCLYHLLKYRVMSPFTLLTHLDYSSESQTASGMLYHRMDGRQLRLGIKATRRALYNTH